MDRPFSKPLIVGNGRTSITIASITEAGAFLLTHWPAKKRRRPAYKDALQACVRGLAGQVEPETVRQALVTAMADLNGKSSPVEQVARSATFQRIRPRFY
jgi:hypothetical protein